MNWYLMALKKFATFSGRSRRKEYWMFFLFNIIFSGVAYALDSLISSGGIIAGIYALAVLVPGLALSVRRLHDIGKGGGFIFINLIPLVGSIWYLILVCQDSNPGANTYGPNPKENAVS